MFDLYFRGHFGNRFRGWRTLEEVEASDYKGPVTMRYAGSAGGGYLLIGIPRRSLRKRIRELVQQGGDPDRMTFWELTPYKRQILVGEIMRSTHYYSLHYSRAPKPLRQALREEGRHAERIEARNIVLEAMDWRAYDRLMELFKIYPNSVVEFSVFSGVVGIYGWNTVFWEVRNY